VTLPKTAVIDGPNIRLKRCRYGWMLYNIHDRYVGRSFDLYGEFSEMEARAFTQLVPQGGVALDIGANIGAHTIPMARLVGSSGIVVAFEPQRILYQMLCANLALNALPNVWTFWAGAGCENGTLRVPPLDYNATNNFGGISLSGGDKGEIVQILPLDSLALSACHFIKIDVEGMEREVIAGAQALIAKWRPLLYVENDRQEKSAALIEALLALDYRLYWHLSPLFHAGNFFGSAENVFSNIISINMLCVPRERNFSVQGLREIVAPEETYVGAPIHAG
jgi:FkbM family methyltransferase